MRGCGTGRPGCAAYAELRRAGIGLLGCLKAGCVLVPVNTRLKGREIDYILRHSGSACYLGQPDLYEEVAGSCSAIAALDRQYLSSKAGGSALPSFDDLLRSPAHSVSLPEIPPDHAAAIIYTSGTTAYPKGSSTVMKR